MIARTEIWIMTELGHLLQLKSLLLIRSCACVLQQHAPEPEPVRVTAAEDSVSAFICCTCRRIHKSACTWSKVIPAQPAGAAWTHFLHPKEARQQLLRLLVCPDPPPPPPPLPSPVEGPLHRRGGPPEGVPAGHGGLVPAERAAGAPLRPAAEPLAAEKGRYFPQELLERKTPGWLLTFASK